MCVYVSAHVRAEGGRDCRQGSGTVRRLTETSKEQAEAVRRQGRLQASMHHEGLAGRGCYGVQDSQDLTILSWIL